MKKYLFFMALLLLPPSVLYGTESLKINVLGVQNEIKQNIEAQLAIEQKELPDNPSSAEIEAFYQRTQTIIRNAASPFGYFSPQIHSQLQHQPTTWIMTYHISLGSPVRIKNIHIELAGEGKNNPKMKEAIAYLPIHNDDIFTTNNYNNAKENLLNTANNQGYIKARYTVNTVKVNTKTLTAEINWRLETNKQYYFGELSFNKSPYAPSFLQRFDTFKAREPFSSDKLIAWQQDLTKTRYFHQVTVTPDLAHTKQNTVPIQVNAIPPKARSYTLGAGYGTFTGPRLSAGMNFRRLTDTGQSLSALLKLSSVFSGLALKYFIPGKNPLTEEWMIGSNYQKFSPKNGESNATTLTVGYTKKLPSWQLNPSINYLVERYSVYNIPQRNSEVFYPKLALTYSHADDALNPTEGKSLAIILQGASERLFSKTEFMQGEIKGMWLTTPINVAHIILRADLGYTAVHDLKDLPLSMRFFAGGINSLRGYPDSSIGPGKYLGTAGIEYRHHVYGNWVGAIFYDIGTATDHLGTPLNQGKGVGVIYESVIGPIKLYAARAISKRGQPYQIEFSIGPEF